MRQRAQRHESQIGEEHPVFAMETPQHRKGQLIVECRMNDWDNGPIVFRRHVDRIVNDENEIEQRGENQCREDTNRSGFKELLVRSGRPSGIWVHGTTTNSWGRVTTAWSSRTTKPA